MSTNSILQTNNKTFLARYWAETSLLSRYKCSSKDLSILSFGCSTGEELLTLKILFPNANLFGCDIDWRNLQIARGLLGNNATIFQSRGIEIIRNGPYDIILCNSVLLSHTKITNGIKRGIPPEVWIDALAELDSTLKPGGLLQIINTNIPFRFHPVACNYEALQSPLISSPNFVDMFDIDDNHLCSGVGGAGWSALLNRHLGESGHSELLVSDFHNIHFHKKGGEKINPVMDEIIPNIIQADCWASGTMTYRPTIFPDSRPSTHTEIDVSWQSVGVENIRLSRTLRRVWFDGSVAYNASALVDITGPSAGSFLEAAQGRPSTHIEFNLLNKISPIKSSSF